MSSTAIESTEKHELVSLTADQITALADKLVVLAVSDLPVVGPADRTNLILASRTLRRLLSAFERETGHELTCLFMTRP